MFYAAWICLLPFVQTSPCDGSKLFASDAEVGAAFGTSLASDGFRMVVGSPGKHETAYVFEREREGWVETTRLEADGTLADNDLGRTVDVFGDAVILGGPRYDHPLQGDDCDGGVVMIYEEQEGRWRRVLEHYGECDDRLGTSVAIAERYAAAGEPYRFEVLVFERTLGGWTTGGSLMAPDGLPEGFGTSVDVEGRCIAVGAPGDAGGRGAVYVFERTASGWTAGMKIVPEDVREGDRFGWTVELAEGWLVVGMPGRDGGEARVLDQGEVRAYACSGPRWQQRAVIRNDALPSGSQFGKSLSTLGSSCMIGAPGAQRAFRFDRRGSEWWCTNEVTPWEGTSGFAAAIAMTSDGTQMVGDPGDDTRASNAGAVYVFDGGLLSVVFCTCEASGPCGNDSPGTGCMHSEGVGARLRSCGSSSVVADDLALIASALPSSQSALVFMGKSSLGSGISFGSGLLCIGGPESRLCRFPVRVADSSDEIVEGPGLAAYSSEHFPSEGQIAVGDTWYFQCLYRDPRGPCGSAFGLTNGLAVTFTP
jgi:hypothetical protein